MVQTECGAEVLENFLYFSPDFVFESVGCSSETRPGAELLTDHKLVVFFLQISKTWPNRKLCIFSVAYRIKWETLADRDVRKQFASSMATKFRQIQKISKSIGMEWPLIKTATILSAVESCGR